jgi:hypothetical protein
MENHMKLTFVILAHKNPVQLQKLTDYLLENGASVFVHIDKKNSAIFHDYIKRNQNKNSLFIYSEFKVYWGSYNQIKATFLLLRNALQYSEFDFISLISGQDLPIKPINELKNFLSTNRNVSFLENHPLPCHWGGNGGLDRFRLLWFIEMPRPFSNLFNKFMVLLHFIQNKMRLYKKISVPVYGGANWFTLNFEMADYVNRFLDNNPDFLKSFRFTRCADEIVLQTILLNSDFKNSIENRNLHLVDWQNGPEYPRTFRQEDFERLKTCNAFFARKFDQDVDNVIINLVYNYIHE